MLETRFSDFTQSIVQDLSILHSYDYCSVRLYYSDTVVLSLGF